MREGLLLREGVSTEGYMNRRYRHDRSFQRFLPSDNNLAIMKSDGLTFYYCEMRNMLKIKHSFYQLPLLAKISKQPQALQLQ